MKNNSFSSPSPAPIPRVLRNFLMGYLVLHLLAAVVLVWVLSRTVKNQMIQTATDRMNGLAMVLSEHIRELDGGMRDASLPEHLAKLGQKTGFRFTVIDADGWVIADSETGTRDIGDHGDRPEILASQFGRPGFASRFSETLQTPMMYVAIEYEPWNGETGGAVRVATPAVAITTAIGSLQKYILLFAVSLFLLTGMLTFWFSNYLLRPLGQFAAAAKKIGVGSYDNLLPTFLARNDEWGALADAMGQMQNELATRERRTTENRDRLEAVLGSMIEGVVAIDYRQRVQIANRAACRILSLTEPEIIDRNLLEIFRMPQLTAAVENTQSTYQFSKVEFETVGEPRLTISARVSVLPTGSEDSENEPGLVVVLHDVTELRQLENMRREFVANVSHELKTPLTSIMASAETLKLGAIHDDQKNLYFVDQIDCNASVLESKIQQLLQLARIESGKDNWDVTPIALDDLCHNCVAQFESEAAAQGVSLLYESNCQSGDNLPMIEGDFEGLSTILKNLIGNALRYTPAGGRIEVSANVVGGEVGLQVSDTGIGIATEHQQRIFERFYRVDAARSSEAGGTGLGLAIVKHLALAFGGTVSVVSKPGKGSTFTVKLPVSIKNS